MERLNEPPKRIDMDSNANKVVDWLKRHVSTIFLVALSSFFLFSGAIALVPNDMDLKEKIIYIFSLMVLGLIITSLVGESGYTAGKESEEYIATRDEALECCKVALPWKKEAELYVSKKIDKDIKDERTEILSKASINYNEIFDSNDVAYPYSQLRKKYNKKQRRAIIQVIKIKKVPFVLFGFTAVKSVGRKQAPSESKRRATKFTTGFLVKALIALGSGSVAVSFLGISLSTFIYSLFQLMLWFGSGLIARLGNYNFIVNTVRGYDQERTWYLKEFNALPQETKETLKMEVSLAESQEEEVKRLTMHIDKSNQPI